jgi:hypothetical protein
MQFTKNLIEENLPTENYYVLTVSTMKGDADDYHEFEVIFNDDMIDNSGEHSLKEYVIACEVLYKAYSKNGRGGNDDYVGKYFELFEDIWPVECNSGSQDSIESYSIEYRDTEGKKYKVEVELSKEDLKEIEMNSAERKRK